MKFNLWTKFLSVTVLVVFVPAVYAAGEEEVIPGGSDVIDAQLGWDFSSPETSLSQEATATPTTEAPAIAFPFGQEPNMGSDAGIPGPFGMGVIPEPMQEALADRQAGGEGLTADITYQSADKAAIAKLNQGLVGLSAQEKEAYIRDNLALYKKNGAIAILAEGVGNVVTNPYEFNKRLPEPIEYYRGNLLDAPKNPDYIGLPDDILRTMTLHPENATPGNVKRLVQSIIVLGKDNELLYGNGTALRVAKAGANEVYLTVGHALEAKGNKNLEILIGNLPPIDIDKDVKINPKYAGDFVRDYETLQRTKPLAPAQMAVAKNIDAGIFSVERKGEQLKEGDLLSIATFSETNPAVGEDVFFYGRPAWIKNSQGEHVKPEIGAVRGKVEKLEFARDNFPKETYFQTDLIAYPGLSGSPLFKIDGRNSNIGGFLSMATREGQDIKTIFVKPSYMRDFIQSSRQTYPITTKTWAEAVKERWDEEFKGAESVDVYKSTYESDGRRSDWYHAYMPDGRVVTGDFIYPRQKDYARER